MVYYRNAAFIPARGGSKSIKLKNIKRLNGRPLIYWALDSAVDCDMIDRVFVSTDNESIRKTVAEYNSEKVTIIERSTETATDCASTESAMLEFANNFEFENIILIQATSPLIKSIYLAEGLAMIESDTYDSILSAVRQKRFIWNMEKGLANPVNYDPSKRQVRQDLQGYYVENGSFYITKKSSLLETKCRLSGRIGMVVMPESSYYEIDEPHDFKIIEGLMKIEKDKNYDLTKIKAFFTDCDGVLTDGGMYYAESGNEFKKFNARDGMGFSLLKENGFVTGIITGENNQIVKRRAEKLGVNELYMSAHDKLSVVKRIAQKYNIDYSEMAYIGDDINDLPLLETVGFSASVADASEQVRQACKYVTKRKGGDGAVREVIDMILEIS